MNETEMSDQLINLQLSSAQSTSSQLSITQSTCSQLSGLHLPNKQGAKSQTSTQKRRKLEKARAKYKLKRSLETDEEKAQRKKM